MYGFAYWQIIVEGKPCSLRTSNVLCVLCLHCSCIRSFEIPSATPPPPFLLLSLIMYAKKVMLLLSRQGWYKSVACFKMVFGICHYYILYIQTPFWFRWKYHNFKVAATCKNTKVSKWNEIITDWFDHEYKSWNFLS